MLCSASGRYLHGPIQGAKEFTYNYNIIHAILLLIIDRMYQPSLGVYTNLILTTPTYHHTQAAHHTSHSPSTLGLGHWTMLPLSEDQKSSLKAH